MTAIKYLLFSGADLVLIGVTTFYVTICLSKPQSLVLFEAQASDRLNGKIPHIKVYSVILLSWIVIGIFLYRGFSFMFSWMPDSWGHYNEDDDFETTAEALAGLSAFFGSIAVMSGLTNAAHKTAKLEQDNEALRHSLDQIRGAGPSRGDRSL
jgi:hypothetical protein